MDYFWGWLSEMKTEEFELSEALFEMEKEKMFDFSKEV